MAYSDRTPEFLDAVQVRNATASDKPSSKHPHKDRERDEQKTLGKEYIAEAYTVVSAPSMELCAMVDPFINVLA